MIESWIMTAFGADLTGVAGGAGGAGGAVEAWLSAATDGERQTQRAKNDR
ncbi:MAG: hypothetical protein ACNA8W_16440 [Bradymonadaceae bacterium]